VNWVRARPGERWHGIASRDAAETTIHCCPTPIPTVGSVTAARPPPPFARCQACDEIRPKQVSVKAKRAYAIRVQLALLKERDMNIGNRIVCDSLSCPNYIDIQRVLTRQDEGWHTETIEGPPPTRPRYQHFCPTCAPGVIASRRG